MSRPENVVRVIAAGPTVVLGEIEIALNAIGIKVEYAEREAAAEQGSLIFRLRLALKMCREWALGDEGYSALTCGYLRDWIDAGMTGPLPWPDDVVTKRWLIQNGYNKTKSGHVGLICNFKVVTAATSQVGPATSDDMNPCPHGFHPRACSECSY